MKKILYILLFALLPSLVVAQVEKSVEVTKDYVPTIAVAHKMRIEPNMVDTVQLRPDIDYEITPLGMTTSMKPDPIRPASVTYWEFNRPRSSYVKLGAGWPLNTIGDIYLTTQNRSTGYLLGYVNHEGRFADVRNDFGVKANSSRMDNRMGFAAGKYLGRRVLEGEISYDNYVRHLYGGVVTDDAPSPKALYSDVGVAVRLGDDFKDLSRTNYNIGLRGNLFSGHRGLADEMEKGRQIHMGIEAAVARQFKKHSLRLQASYEHDAGERALADYGRDMASAGVRYGYDSKLVNFEAGLDYYYDKLAWVGARHYVVPAVRLRFDLDTKAFVPEFVVDGGVRDNSLRRLVQINPYTSWDAWPSRSTVEYNFRLGISGDVGHGRFVYRLFGELSVCKNQLYWLVNRGFSLTPVLADQTVSSINAQMEYKPVHGLLLTLGVQAYGYNNKTPVGVYGINGALAPGAPNVRASAGVRYKTGRFSIGVEADMIGRRQWSMVDPTGGWQAWSIYNAPIAVDLRADADWRITKGFSIFGEVRNILDMECYDMPFYRDYGVNFTTGLKLTF